MSSVTYSTQTVAVERSPTFAEALAHSQLNRMIRSFEICRTRVARSPVATDEYSCEPF